MTEEFEKMIEALEAVVKAAREKMTKAHAAWMKAEEFVSLSEHDGEDLKGTKADAYDAREVYDQAHSEFIEAHDTYIQTCQDEYYREEIAAGRISPDPEPVTVDTDDLSELF
jgi:hypothetical protein